MRMGTSWQQFMEECCGLMFDHVLFSVQSTSTKEEWALGKKAVRFDQRCLPFDGMSTFGLVMLLPRWCSKSGSASMAFMNTGSDEAAKNLLASFIYIACLDDRAVGDHVACR